MALIIALVVAPLTILTLYFTAEVLAGLRPLPVPAQIQQSAARAVIVVPAHDEATSLPKTLPKLMDAARGLARVLVVADNCSDRTAAIARELGAEVVERFDTTLRGKGFALAFAKDHLKTEAPEVVLIVDADCLIDRASLASLIETCAATGRPCQATNLQEPSPRASPTVQLSTFAFYIKNVVRLRGLERLAGRAHLLGTGMAIPWKALAEIELATSSIVEDLKLGLELAARGHRPTFVEAANVWSNAESEQNSLSQRRRWEGGFLANALKAGPSLLLNSLRKGDLSGIWAALDVMTPPFALLLLLDGTVLAVGILVSWAAGASAWPVAMLGGSILLASLALGIAWAKGGSRFVSLGALLRAPLYLAWKLPIYFGFLARGVPKEWVRTHRGEL